MCSLLDHMFAGANHCLVAPILTLSVGTSLPIEIGTCLDPAVD